MLDTDTPVWFLLDDKPLSAIPALEALIAFLQARGKAALVGELGALRDVIETHRRRLAVMVQRLNEAGLYWDRDHDDPFKGFYTLREKEQFLRDQGHHDEADEAWRLLLEMETTRRRLSVMASRLHNVVRTAERWASGDDTEQDLDQAWEALSQGAGSAQGPN